MPYRPGGTRSASLCTKTIRPLPPAMFDTLLADDNPSFRRSLRRILNRHYPSMRIAEAGNVLEAATLGFARRHRLVFTDIKLPDGNGLDLARRIKTADPAAHVCVVTQYDIPEYREAARRCGADHFIVKDETTEETIVALVDALLAAQA